MLFLDSTDVAAPRFDVLAHGDDLIVGEVYDICLTVVPGNTPNPPTFPNRRTWGGSSTCHENPDKPGEGALHTGFYYNEVSGPKIDPTVGAWIRWWLEPTGSDPVHPNPLGGHSDVFFAGPQR